MTAFVQVAYAMIDNTWNFLQNITIPGINIHASSLFFAVFLIGITFRILEKRGKDDG